MPTQSLATAKILANVHRYFRFYLASFLTGMLALLLVVSARLEPQAAGTPPAADLSKGAVAVALPHAATPAGPWARHRGR